ncbi:MAG TPA: FxLYD domain-containing protein [Candidatus Paceibacterota bacterium]|nr:FxLYD domain-containing protein [Candidatus Paceibacterota bacterium]
MSTRRAKQMIYGVFFLIMWGAIFAGVYYAFVKPAPSCFDTIQNQGEAGVDCGGPCAQVCIPAGIQPITPIQHEAVHVFQTDSSHATFLAHIVNPNAGYATRDFTYHLAVHDSTGALAQSLSGTSFIYGSEVKYVLLPNVSLSQGGIGGKIDLTVDQPAWIPASAFPGPPRFTISGKNTVASAGAITVSGEIANNDTVVFPAVTIVAVLLNRLGQPAGVSQTEIENLAPNQSAPFSVIYPSLANLDLQATQVYAYAERP